jgi:protein-tyrosine phosphatase
MSRCVEAMNGSNPAPSADATSALLVLDAGADQSLSRFRDARAFELRGSASAQFSLRGWAELKVLLPERFFLVDLREESHCFAEGNALGWYATQNWSCAGLSGEESARLEALRIRILRLAGEAEVGTKDDVRARRRPAQTWKTGSAVDEPGALGLDEGRYLRLPVTDHCAPGAEVVEQFLRFVSGLPEGAHVHFHCRGGKGRSATFLAMLDMLANARRVSFDALIARQASLGVHDLRKAPDEGSAKRPFLVERWSFLSRFHEFARGR